MYVAIYRMPLFVLIEGGDLTSSHRNVYPIYQRLRGTIPRSI